MAAGAEGPVGTGMISGPQYRNLMQHYEKKGSSRKARGRRAWTARRRASMCAAAVLPFAPAGPSPPCQKVLSAGHPLHRDRSGQPVALVHPTHPGRGCLPHGQVRPRPAAGRSPEERPRGSPPAPPLLPSGASGAPSSPRGPAGATAAEQPNSSNPLPPSLPWMLVRPGTEACASSTWDCARSPSPTRTSPAWFAPLGLKLAKASSLIETIAEKTVWQVPALLDRPQTAFPAGGNWITRSRRSPPSFPCDQGCARSAGHRTELFRPPLPQPVARLFPTLDDLLAPMLPLLFPTLPDDLFVPGVATRFFFRPGT